jgi:hypothetical protein
MARQIKTVKQVAAAVDPSITEIPQGFERFVVTK